MSAVTLTPSDLETLSTLAGDLNFNDEERRAALLESSSRDFNAVPGSGKTSLLAAKLILLAKKWPYSHRGICILSHTNVARDEIARRLAQTPEGSQLLSYPHFIGTIHSFVNQFFAMPMLRSMQQKIDVIDDLVFAEKAMRLLQHSMFAGLRGYLARQHNGDDIVSTLFYRTGELALGAEKGRLPGAATPSFRALLRIKDMLATDGIFRHRDMFAYADLALTKCPHLEDVVHRRFPMVFIDEMQDTSLEQEALLNRIFDGKSVMQRFGDIDQKILSDEEGMQALTFPRTGYGVISTSKRFGDAIADAVGQVRISGDRVVGEGVNVCAPILLLYAPADVTKVIPHFQRIVMGSLVADDMSEGTMKVMCARKGGDSNQEAGRHLVDYWPAFGEGPYTTGRRQESVLSLLGDPRGALRDTSLSKRVADVRRALLLVLRAANAPWIRQIHDARALPRAAKAEVPEGEIETLTRQLALEGEALCADDNLAALLALLYAGLSPYLPEECDAETFRRLAVFTDVRAGLGVGLATSSSSCAGSPEVVLGTIASMKGETHVASLVLESYGGNSRQFDVALGLTYIAGQATKALAKLPKTQQAQMRNLYVAMSRPTTLLCLAANENRIPQSLRDGLVAKGWHIETVC